MPPRRSLIVVCLLALGLSACAGNPTPSVAPAIVSEQLAAAVSRAQMTEIRLYQEGQVSEMDHHLWQRRFLALGEGILAFNQTMRAMNPTMREDAIRRLLEIVDELVEVFVPHLDFDQAKLTLTGSMEIIRSILVTMSLR